MADQDGPPIIIKKRKHGHGHHGGAWKVAYADFVTAMMALFIVLWILGQDESIKIAVAGYFKDPIGFGSSQGKSVIEGKAPALTPDIESELLKRETEKEILKKMGEKIMDALSSDPDFSDITDQVKIETVDEGLRIEIIDSAEDFFFEIGTAQLKPEAVKLITRMGDYLAKLPNKVVLEGHTDSRPYGNTDYTNYELSADRANSARRALLLSALDPGRIDEIRGYADKRLRDTENPFNVVNRRISIIVKYLNK